MEVMKPELYWVNGRCYRRNPCRNDYGLQRRGGQESQQSLAPYVEPDDDEAYGRCDPDAPDMIDVNYDITETTSGFKTRCTNIPNVLFAGIIGPKGATKKRLEIETKTQIVVPRMNEKGPIVINGERRKDVETARRRVDLLAAQYRFKREPTHFICFPLNSTSVIQKVREFKEKVLAEFKGPSYGIDSKVFQEPEKIHLTISVMMLLDAGERTVAASLLEKIQPQLKEMAAHGNLRFRLEGLEIMNDDPTQVDVLYAKCRLPDESVQSMADFISAASSESGFAKNAGDRSVKLHATLMNTRFRNEGETPTPNESGPGNNRGRQSMNAKPLLEKYGDYDFGFVEIREVHLSTRYTKGPDGFYKPFAKISLK